MSAWAQGSSDGFARFAVSTPSLSAGQSATLLPNGRWLIAGGPIGEASDRLWMTRGGELNSSRELLSIHMAVARSGQAATVLPDGKVLILGGQTDQEELVTTAELFDPQAMTIETLPDTGLMPRTRHTATLLTDGRVLIAGGLGADGQPLLRSELFDSRTSKALPMVADLAVPRSGQQSSLLANGKDLVWGGQDGNGKTLASGELFDPVRNGFAGVNWWDTTALPPTELTQAGPQLEQSLPAANATGVAVGTSIALRFSKPLRVASIGKDTVTLVGPDGAVEGKVVAAEAGMLAFFTPTIELRPDTTYTLFVKNAVDAAGHALPFTSFSFTTQRLDGNDAADSASSSSKNGSGSSLASHGGKGSVGGVVNTAGGGTVGSQADGDVAAAGAGDDSEDWIPQEANRHGDWRILGLKQDPVLHSDALSLPSAKPGVTAVSGRVLRLNGLPIAGVPVSAYGKSTVTDRDGRFLLEGLGSGIAQIKVDGSGVISHGRHYTSHFIEVNVTPGQTTAVETPVYLPRVDPATEVSIPSPADRELVLTHPAIPGLEVHIPKGAVLREYDGKIVTKLSITPIPINRAPYPAPVPFSTYFTLQPGGAYVDGAPDKAIRIVYPNYLGLSPNAVVNFWNYDPGSKGWRVYGKGHVTADGKQIVPNPGVGFRQIMTFGFGVSGSSPAPATGPSCPKCAQGDPVDISTGLFIHEVTDISLPDVMPIALTRTYHQNDPTFHEFGLGTTMAYAMYIENPSTNNTYGTINLVLADGTRIPFTLKSGSSASLSGDNVYINNSPTEYQGALLTVDSKMELFYVTMRGGTKLTFSTHHTNNQLQSISDASGNTVTLAIEGSDIVDGGQSHSGQIDRITSPNGRYIALTYQTCTDQNGVQHPVIHQATDNIGRYTLYNYDGRCRLHTAQDLAGKTETYDYDASDRMTLVTDKNGKKMVSNDSFDSGNRVTQQTVGQDADAAVWQYTYTLDSSNSYVSQAKVIDPRLYTSIYQFNASGQVTDVQLAQGKPEYKHYHYNLDDSSRITDIIDYKDSTHARTTHYEYHDTYGGPTLIRYLDNNNYTYQLAYDPVFHNLTSVTDPVGNTTRVTYNAQGRPYQLIDGRNYVTTIGYDGNGQGLPTSLTDANAHTWQFAYAGGDLASVTDPKSDKTTLFTDAVGRVLTVKDALGRSQSMSYDGMNRLLQSTDALSGVTKIGYDNNGNAISAEDARQVAQGAQGKSHGYTPDTHNRVHLYTDPLGKSITYGYDGMNNLVSMLDRNQNTTKIDYDGLNRPIKVSYQGGSTLAIHWLDSSDQIQLVDSINGTITITYDDLFRIVKETGPQGEVDYVYYNDGRRKSMTVSGQSAVKYTYYGDGRLWTVTQGSNVVTLTYDPAGRPKKVSLPNGVAATYKFDNANRLQSISYDNNGTALGSVNYGFDAANQVVSRGGSLVSFLQPSQTTSSAAYDASNRLTSWSGSSLTFDDSGNLKTGFGNSYGWNDRNQLSSVNSVPLSYDALGRRVGYKSGGASHSVLFDGANPVLLDGSSFMLSGLGADQNFAKVTSAGAADVLTDGLSSTLAMTSATGKSIATTISYDSYGNTSVSGGDGIPLQYTGRENQGDGGIYYYRNRYYSPQMGRFISQDPIGLAGGMNAYGYVDGNPIGYSDPSGNCPFCIAVGVGAIYGAISGAYGAFIGGGSWKDMAIAAAIGGVAGGVAGAATFGAPFLAAVVLNGYIAMWANGVGQRIAIDNTDPCKPTPKFNFGAALMSGAAGSVAGIFGPFAGEALGAVVGATLMGAPADMAINAASNSYFPTQYGPPQSKCCK